MKYSRGQIGIMETIMVLVIIVMLLIMGIVVYFKFFHEKIIETGEELEVQQFSVLLNSLTSMPEFQCSEGALERSCVDVVKLYAAKESIESNKPPYFEKFGYKKIYFKQIYPVTADQECTKNDFMTNNPCNTWTIYDNLRAGRKAIVSTPVSLYLQTEDEYYIGNLVVEI